MRDINNFDADYKNWVVELKSKIRSVQVKAAFAVNSALIGFYWDLGKIITEKQTHWGSQFLVNLSKDLQAEFPNMQGLSLRNLKYTRQFYQFYSSAFLQQTVEELGQQPVAQLPWGHNILIFSKSKNIDEAKFYISQTIENNWSRDVLALQIKLNLFGRQGKAITNFKHTLPAPLSDLAEQTLKDPYIFDFMALSKPYREKDIENQLTAHITKFLL